MAQANRYWNPKTQTLWETLWWSPQHEAILLDAFHGGEKGVLPLRLSGRNAAKRLTDLGLCTKAADGRVHITLTGKDQAQRLQTVLNHIQDRNCG